MSLKEGKCEACRIDAPTVTAEEKDKFLVELNDWKVILVEGVEQLHKIYKFDFGI